MYVSWNNILTIWRFEVGKNAGHETIHMFHYSCQLSERYWQSTLHCANVPRCNVWVYFYAFICAIDQQSAVPAVKKWWSLARVQLQWLWMMGSWGDFATGLALACCWFMLLVESVRNRMGKGKQQHDQNNPSRNVLNCVALCITISKVLFFYCLDDVQGKAWMFIMHEKRVS